MYENSNPDELMHYGVKGMKLGVIRSKMQQSSARRKQEKKERKEVLTSYKKDKGPKRYGTFNAANSAARTYYRGQRTNSFKTYRKQQGKLDIRTARLSSNQVAEGRYRVARARNIKRKTVSSILGTAAGIAAVSAGGAAVAPFAAIGVAAISNLASGGHYYSRQQRAYGSTRAKYEVKSRKKKD